jgi:hypothetical protein
VNDGSAKTPRKHKALIDNDDSIESFDSSDERVHVVAVLTSVFDPVRRNETFYQVS